MQISQTEALECRGHRRAGDVAAAAAECRHLVVGRHALEARDDDDLALAELLDDARGVDRLDAGPVEGAIGADVALRAGERDRRHALILQREGKGGDRDLLSRCEKEIVIAAVRVLRDLPGKRDELVRGLSHRGDRHHDMRMRLEIGLHPCRNGKNLLGGGHRASTVLLHDDRA